mgnify:FL=1
MPMISPIHRSIKTVPTTGRGPLLSDRVNATTARQRSITTMADKNSFGSQFTVSPFDRWNAN